MFENLLELFANIWKIMNYAFLVLRRRSPESSEFIIILEEKAMETCNSYKILLNYKRVFIFRSKFEYGLGKLDDFWKILNNLKETKKPIAKFCTFGLKNI